MDYETRDGRTALNQAAWCGQEAALRLLTARYKAEPDRDSKRGRTALMEAALGGHEASMEALVDAKAAPRHLASSSEP